MIYSEKNRGKLLQKKIDRYIIFKEIIRNYIGVEIRLRAMQEKLIHNK